MGGAAGVRRTHVSGPFGRQRACFLGEAEGVPNGVVKRRGRFSLVQSDPGFTWRMYGPDGGHWYWHPDQARWTARPCVSTSPKRVAAGMNPKATQAAAGICNAARQPVRFENERSS